jgi:hypothetical protein
MSKALVTAKGIGGQVELSEDRITIKRKGAIAFMAHGLKGDKEILISQISAVQLRKAGVTNGYIQFSFLGGTEARGGFVDATHDENSVVFNVWQQKPFLVLKERLDEMLTSSRTGAKATSNLDELEKLAGLKEKGIITEEEFNQKKKQLLGL